MSTDGDMLDTGPVQDSRHERIGAAMLRVSERHAEAFEKLAQ